MSVHTFELTECNVTYVISKYVKNIYKIYLNTYLVKSKFVCHSASIFLIPFILIVYEEIISIYSIYRMLIILMYSLYIYLRYFCLFTF